MQIRTSWRACLTTLAALMMAAACSSVGSKPPVSEADRVAQEVPRGLAYARAHCASCHAVAPGDRASPNSAAPPFETVADMTGMTNIVLNVWLRSKHPGMPDIAVPDAHVGDLSAYLASLKGEPDAPSSP